jgi:hypothetical protein
MGNFTGWFFAFEKIPETTSGAIFLKELSETPLNVQDPSLKKDYLSPCPIDPVDASNRYVSQNLEVE